MTYYNTLAVGSPMASPTVLAREYVSYSPGGRCVVHTPFESAIQQANFPMHAPPLSAGANIHSNERFHEESKLLLPLDVHRNVVRTETATNMQRGLLRNRAGVPL
ncbi:hypothetical protein DIPPA_12039 [Diplonema papillatum]|nr:hypothetical protein DIPPA_12039 [Diplonema papillatum]